MRGLLRVLRRIGWILPRLLAKRHLPGSSAKTSSGLHARLSDSDIVLRGIQDKFEKAIIFCFLIDDDRRLVDLAADSDDIAADDCRSVTEETLLRIGT